MSCFDLCVRPYGMARCNIADVTDKVSMWYGTLVETSKRWTNFRGQHTSPESGNFKVNKLLSFSGIANHDYGCLRKIDPGHTASQSWC